MNRVDVVVIGGGIAGASVAAELSDSLRVLLLERESQPGYHSTGRSAALFSETYGKPLLRLLSRASRAFLESPPATFAQSSLLRPRGVMLIGRADQKDSVRAEIEDIRNTGKRVQEIDSASALARVPILRPGYVSCGMYEQDAMDIDVHALHQGYIRVLSANGSAMRCSSEVESLTFEGSDWRIECRGFGIHAGVVVNAAGAWGDAIAARAGIVGLGLGPLRRTAVLLDLPPGMDAKHWPMVRGADEEFYFKPDSGRLLASPADETPSEPCDAQPEELDMALCVEAIEKATTLAVSRIAGRWAGLRTFSPDRIPVVGFDPRHPGFFWLVGQGGYGIQTAPAMSRLAASLIQGQAVPGDIDAMEIDASALSPVRFG